MYNKIMDTLILFDLEETVIESFEQPFFIMPNIRKIENFLSHDEFRDARFGVMSWAIWNWSRTESEVFDGISIALQEELDIHSNRFDGMFTLSMDQWVSILWKTCGVKVDRDELPHIFNKEDFLFKIRKFFAEHKIARVVLIDDAVEHNLTITSPSVTIEFRNIEDM